MTALVEGTWMTLGLIAGVGSQAVAASPSSPSRRRARSRRRTASRRSGRDPSDGSGFA
jgi:hypothetical protein